MNTETAMIVVVDDHRQVRESIGHALESAGYHVASFGSAEAALAWLVRNRADVVLTDLQMPGMDGLQFLRALNERRVDSQVIVLTAHGTVATAVEAMRIGAFDFIEKPFEAGQLETIVERALTQDRPLRRPAGGGSRGETSPSDGGVMVGSSRVMRTLRRQIARVARVDETVLIMGESGTGKELVARAIHEQSARSNGPLVGLNCPALSPQLMESELFGHERGAFTGADMRRIGRFELARQGTLLLDEVTEIDPALQAKLLRVLQERAFERVGSSETIEADVRVLATSNRSLETEVAEGRFREDLYFRLAVVPMWVPPLRARRDDIPELVQHFLRHAARRVGREPIEFDESAMNRLMEYDWPGNVRQLENLVKRATVLHDGERLSADDLEAWLGELDSASRTRSTVDVGLSLQEMERQLIEATLEQFGGHREKTAKALGIGVRTLTNKLRSYGYPPRATFA